MLLAWPLIVCYLCFVFTVVAKQDSSISNDNNNDNDSVRLRVSIRKNTLKGVPSCQHTFSQIELLNLVGGMSHATCLIYKFQVCRNLLSISTITCIRRSRAVKFFFLRRQIL